ncbi:peptidylprolyl isomerase [Parvularcula sp. ZS-1/3]|uniref:peptidylprolyl isomerase n=1 Tax=Parvularcula mediterranea TaxID=2732508 RepID=A0A7Y3W4E7_9PROT|nr:peptidylprolyl isomerase [Parvularcula mediterranea]NNU15156.1 peptidylprolyl isomerase [Parvularcula mediterranea]
MRRLLSALLVSTGIAFSASAVAQTSEPTVSERILSTADASEWRTVDPENILVMDLPSGPVLIEMQPEYAPLHVERVKRLAREGFYDNTIFHRVIDGFMAQGGDPTGTGAGGSEYPDLKGRFASERKQLPNFVPLGRDDRASQIGFLGSLPMGSQTPALTDFVITEDVAAWPLHCPGVVSMARAGPDSANSQFFIMFADNRRTLDKSYTAWGRVVSGERNVRRINRGEPPERPTPMLRARVMADLPADEKQRVEVLRSDSETFKAWLRATDSITDDGFFVDACAVNVPVRIDGENV